MFHVLHKVPEYFQRKSETKRLSGLIIRMDFKRFWQESIVKVSRKKLLKSVSCFSKIADVLHVSFMRGQQTWSEKIFVVSFINFSSSRQTQYPSLSESTKYRRRTSPSKRLAISLHFELISLKYTYFNDLYQSNFIERNYNFTNNAKDIIENSSDFFIMTLILY